MTELLKADADALRSLGQTLGGNADAIRSIGCVPLPVMPGSPIEGASRSSDREVRLSYTYMATTIDTLGDQITKAANTYEDVDRIFADRLKAYRAGR